MYFIVRQDLFYHWGIDLSNITKICLQSIRNISILLRHIKIILVTRNTFPPIRNVFWTVQIHSFISEIWGKTVTHMTIDILQISEIDTIFLILHHTDRHVKLI